MRQCRFIHLVRLFGLGCFLVTPGLAGATRRPQEKPGPAPAAAQAAPAFEPTAAYVVRHIEGWEIRIHPDLVGTDKLLGAEALRELEFQLYQITRAVPNAAVFKLRQVPIWLEKLEPHTPCAAYHPGRDWLVQHGINPDKTHCVEIANAANFIHWTHDQPWMVLHELSHAYHDQFLPDGFGNKEIRACYDAAVKNGLYSNVARARTKEKVKAYALTNPMEYFAEATDAYFGLNDFYPFNQVELFEYDPELFRLLTKFWGVENPSFR